MIPDAMLMMIRGTKNGLTRLGPRSIKIRFRWLPTVRLPRLSPHSLTARQGALSYRPDNQWPGVFGFHLFRVPGTTVFGLYLPLALRVLG